MQNYWASSQTYWIRNRSRPSNLSFKKPSRRSWCIWKFENDCCRLEQRNIFFIMWLCSFSHQEKSSLSTPLESGLVLWSALTNRMWQYWQCTSCVPWPQEFFHFSSPLVPWHCHVYNPRIAYSNMRAHGGEPRYPSWGHQDQAIASQLPDTCENPAKIRRAAYRTHSQCMSKASQE